MGGSEEGERQNARPAPPIRHLLFAIRPAQVAAGGRARYATHEATPPGGFVMASTPEGSSPPGDRRGRRKRPGPPTIDLKGTEVASETPPAGVDEAPNPPAEQPGSAGDAAAAPQPESTP